MYTIHLPGQGTNMHCTRHSFLQGLLQGTLVEGCFLVRFQIRQEFLERVLVQALIHQEEEVVVEEAEEEGFLLHLKVVEDYRHLLMEEVEVVVVNLLLQYL